MAAANLVAAAKVRVLRHFGFAEPVVIFGLSCCGLFLTSGCAHYYLPASRLISPEAVGTTSRSGTLEWLSLQSGSNLTDAAVLSKPKADSGESPKPELQKSWVNYALGVSKGLSETTELSVRIQPFAPLVVAVKHQLLGMPSDKAESGNFSLAVSAQAGLMLGEIGASGVSYYLFDGGLYGGYRPWKRHLFLLGPFFSLAGLSGGVSAQASGSASQYGAAVGYQYDIEALFTRVEAVWLSGSYGTAAIGGYFGGAMVGFVL